jgi:hypothetical protein
MFMKRIIPVLTTSFLLTAATAAFGQATPPPADKQAETRARAETKDADVTYGRVKELTAGQKVVIDIDNAPDKSFDLTNKDLTVKLAKDLKVWRYRKSSRAVGTRQDEIRDHHQTLRWDRSSRR